MKAIQCPGPPDHVFSRVVSPPPLRAAKKNASAHVPGEPVSEGGGGEVPRLSHESSGSPGRS